MLGGCPLSLFFFFLAIPTFVEGFKRAKPPELSQGLVQGKVLGRRACHREEVACQGPLAGLSGEPVLSCGLKQQTKGFPDKRHQFSQNTQNMHT